MSQDFWKAGTAEVACVAGEGHEPEARLPSPGSWLGSPNSRGEVWNISMTVDKNTKDKCMTCAHCRNRRRPRSRWGQLGANPPRLTCGKRRSFEQRQARVYRQSIEKLESLLPCRIWSSPLPAHGLPSQRSRRIWRQLQTRTEYHEQSFLNHIPSRVISHDDADEEFQKALQKSFEDLKLARGQWAVLFAWNIIFCNIWQEDEDKDYQQALKASGEAARKDEDEKDRQEPATGHKTTRPVSKFVTLARDPKAKSSKDWEKARGPSIARPATHPTQTQSHWRHQCKGSRVKIYWCSGLLPRTSIQSVPKPWIPNTGST